MFIYSTEHLRKHHGCIVLKLQEYTNAGRIRCQLGIGLDVDETAADRKPELVMR
jgi:hypothetical protein